jgi:hypothetical protein
VGYVTDVPKYLNFAEFLNDFVLPSGNDRDVYLFLFVFITRSAFLLASNRTVFVSYDINIITVWSV